jgi:glycosyltransferase involved in cell wall biosynthesis
LFTRRHIPDLIHGFAVAAGQVPEARLVLVGDNRTEPRIDPRAVAADAGVGDRVVWREYVTDANLEELYQSARVFAFLSDYEGFAMTPLEALAHGVAPVLLDTPVAHEVYGDAATYVSADAGVIGAALTRLLTDPKARQCQLDAGMERLSRFSWTQAATTIGTALEQAAESRARDDRSDPVQP